MRYPQWIVARLSGLPLFVAAASVLAAGQTPLGVDVSLLGPRVGSPAPPFSGTDQAGRTITLASTLGAKGAMIVFFRSADW
jgi:hypothetical protein